MHCGAIPEDLLESEMFGHERGAFTGAVASRVGRFKLADGGSIFLDEIGEMSAKLQVKLLRVLEDGRFEAVGSVVTQQVEVRVIAATNRSLEQAVAGRQFREDLFYRLRVVPIEMPPLRRRREDIPLLIETILGQLAARGLPRFTVTAEATELMQRYPWPGNVRELRNVLEQMVVLGRPEQVIDASDLPPHLVAPTCTWVALYVWTPHMNTLVPHPSTPTSTSLIRFVTDGLLATIESYQAGNLPLHRFAWELHTTNPMLDMHFFEDPRFSAASGAITLVFLSLFGTLFLLTQYLQSVLGYSTVKAGAVLLPQAATIMTFAPLSNIWVQRIGNKVVVTAGLLLVTASMGLFTTFEPNSSVVHVIGVTVLLGLGMANVMAPCTDSIMGSLPRAKAGVGSAVNDTAKATKAQAISTGKIGGALPAPLFAAVKDNVGTAMGVVRQPGAAQPFAGQIARAARESFVGGLHVIGLTAAAVTLLAAIGVALFLPARARDEVDLRVDVPPLPVEVAVG